MNKKDAGKLALAYLIRECIEENHHITIFPLKNDPHLWCACGQWSGWVSPTAKDS